jgi:hypothetical protein
MTGIYLWFYSVDTHANIVQWFINFANCKNMNGMYTKFKTPLFCFYHITAGNLNVQFCEQKQVLQKIWVKTLNKK